jgi:hypothetical protein
MEELCINDTSEHAFGLRSVESNVSHGTLTRLRSGATFVPRVRWSPSSTIRDVPRPWIRRNEAEIAHDMESTLHIVLGMDGSMDTRDMLEVVFLVYMHFQHSLFPSLLLFRFHHSRPLLGASPPSLLSEDHADHHVLGS